MKSVKQSSMSAVNQRQGTDGELWQPRFFDRALRTVKEHNEKVEYIHLNPRVAPTSAFMSATLKKPGQATDRTC
jgi:hypothetical protein